VSSHKKVIDESTRLCGRGLFDEVPLGDRAGAWKDMKAFEIHSALILTRAAGHLVDVCLATLLQLMVAQAGFRKWGHTGFGSYVTQELRQRSARRFQYLVAIERAMAEGPLPTLRRAWRRGEVTVSQARELIQVMTPDNEQEWLSVAASCSVEGLRQRVKQARQAEAGRAERQQVRAQNADLSAPPDDDVRWEMKSFSATRPVDAAWQVCLETTRRMAGLDLPVHECVDDLLAEFSSGRPAAAGDMPAADPDNEDPDHRDAWHHAARLEDEAWRSLRGISDVMRTLRLAVDPLEGVGGPVKPAPAAAAPDGLLDPEDLHRRIVWLLRLDGNISWHQCHLMRVMADLKLPRRLGFSSLRQYAVEALGAGDRSPFSWVRLARELDRLPKVAAAFRGGLITSLQAEELCKVCRPGTQSAWIDRARTVTLAALREDVAFVLDVQEPSGLPPARPLGGDRMPCAAAAAGRDWVESHASGAGDRRVQICAPRTSDAVVVPLARRVEGWYGAFGEDRDGMAALMLSAAGPRRPVMFLAPSDTARRWDLALAYCRMLSSGPTAPDQSQCVAILLLDFLDQWASPEVMRSSQAYQVFTRDGWRCQVPNCRTRARLHAHHIIFRSRNGPDAAWNLVTVCRQHHGMIHAGVIRARGRAPSVEWSMGVGPHGRARERFVNGTRVALDPDWSAGFSARNPASGAARGPLRSAGSCPQ